MCYHSGGEMPDVLIRNFSADDLELLDKQARRLGLSRSEFLRRQLHQEPLRQWPDGFVILGFDLRLVSKGDDRGLIDCRARRLRG